MYVLIKEVHVVIRTELKTLGTLLFTFLFKKKFKVTIHFMDSHNHVFISHRILEKNYSVYLENIPYCDKEWYFYLP